jgi:preprotein translocase subunit SecD
MRIATVVLVALLQGCTVGPDTELALEVDSSDPAVVEAAARVLAARFDAFRPSPFSSSTFDVKGSKVRFTFKNGAPEPKVLEYLYTTLGSLQARLTAERLQRPWFTDRDVARAVVAYRDSMRVLRVRLTPEAGERLLRLTSANVGESMTLTLDGETLMEARISGAFGRDFEVAGPELDPELYLALGVVLSTGALPTTVRAVTAAEI